MKLALFICFSLTLVQFISSFCIYNKMSQYVVFSAKQEIDHVDPFKIFTANLEPGQSQCCHYTNLDCTHDAKNNETATFEVRFFRRADQARAAYKVTCTSGGGLSFYNIGDKYAANCTYPSGRTEVVGMAYIG